MAKKNEIVSEKENLIVPLNSGMDLYYIEWEDAIAHTGWMSQGSGDRWFENQTMIVKQVGWVAKEKPHYIGFISRMSVWSDEKGADIEYGLLQKIPTTWIRKRIKLTKYIK